MIYFWRIPVVAFVDSFIEQLYKECVATWCTVLKVDKDTGVVSAAGFSAVCSRLCPRLFSDLQAYVLSRLYGATTGFMVSHDRA